MSKALKAILPGQPCFLCGPRLDATLPSVPALSDTRSINDETLFAYSSFPSQAVEMLESARPMGGKSKLTWKNGMRGNGNERVHLAYRDIQIFKHDMILRQHISIRFFTCREDENAARCSLSLLATCSSEMAGRHRMRPCGSVHCQSHHPHLH